ncbi:hypothetical protein B0T19DRAFT_421869 [Cercophora scortea]|uniref:Uncharacterized protein n=1 Tax=Cercophora scortea TaxID=314031 RepID=A0AAE0IM08_9PEZI|nr:hypothetical protein B0T19DRAFT_421869 [Cercophora scortea]
MAEDTPKKEKESPETKAKKLELTKFGFALVVLGMSVFILVMAPRELVLKVAAMYSIGVAFLSLVSIVRVSKGYAMPGPTARRVLVAVTVLWLSACVLMCVAAAYEGPGDYRRRSVGTRRGLGLWGRATSSRFDLAMSGIDAAVALKSLAWGSVLFSAVNLFICIAQWLSEHKQAHSESVASYAKVEDPEDAPPLDEGVRGPRPVAT